MVLGYDELENLVAMLSVNRCENRAEWLEVGRCLCNLGKSNIHIWRNWSKLGKNYEHGMCEDKWPTFRKNKKIAPLDTLLGWAKIDDPDQYTVFMRMKKIGSLILAKFPNDILKLGDNIRVTEKCNYTQLRNADCLIKGTSHVDYPHSMYVEMIDNYVCIKCKHNECFGKIYPCEHIQLTKNEMNMINIQGNINITINNKDIEEIAEFNQIDLYDDKDINTLVFNSLNGEASSLAEIIYHCHKDTHMYGEDNRWYIFENHRWKNIGAKNTKLRNSIKHKLKELYVPLKAHYEQNRVDNKKKIDTIKQIIKSFDNTTLKNNIMIELIDLFTENKNPSRDFTKKLDANGNLIGFDNGVYDMEAFVFRDGHPTDYITLSTGYEYCGQHSEKYNDLLVFLSDIQPQSKELEYMLTYLSTALLGNMLELFTIMTGSGRNGKSKLIELIRLTFGNYFGAAQSQMFTRPRPDATTPDPGLLSLMRKKIVVASEPEKNSKLNSGFIKFITGRDTTALRHCHENTMFEFSANFSTLLICNDIPECDGIDSAFSKRLRCIHFPTEFVDNPVDAHQKQIDVRINEHFCRWKMDFMLLLIGYYKKYCVTKVLDTTENILKWTDMYKENTDVYFNYLNQNTEQSDTHLKTTTLYEHFKQWYKTNNPQSKIPNSREFVSNIKKHKTIEHVKIDKSSCYGIKYLAIIEM